MKLERISAIVQTRPPQTRAGLRLPANGESLSLTYASSIGGDLLATTSDGLALRLAGLARWHRDLQPGDTLRVRVLANEPMLELELEGAPLRGPMLSTETSESESRSVTRHTAMRLDQAVLRQIAWQVPNAAALALSWRHLAQDRWNSGLFSPQALGELPNSAPTTMLGAAPFREPSATWAPNPDRCLLPVYAWGGAQMFLGLQESDAEGHARDPDRRRQFILRLELTPAALGYVLLQAQWLPGGLQLWIAVEHVESVSLVRAVLPRIRTALIRAGLPLIRVRLTQGLAAVTILREVPTPASHAYFVAQQTSLLLFRVLSEAAVVLLQVVPEASG